MKTIKTTLLLLFCVLHASAQNQFHNWILFSTDLSANPTLTNIQFNPSPAQATSLPSYKATPLFYDEQTTPALITSWRGFNAFYDNDGFPVMYVINKNNKTYIFDKKGRKYTKEADQNSYAFLKNNVELPLAGTPYVPAYNDGTNSLNNTSREISIIKTGCNLFHVITGEQIIEVNIETKTWKYFIPFTSPTPTTYESQFLNAKGITSFKFGSGTSQQYFESFHSVRRLSAVSYRVYFLYTTDPYNGDTKPKNLTYLDVNAELYTVNYGSNPFYINPTGSIPVTFSNNVQFIPELEVSPDGTKLAISDNGKLFLFSIGTNGQITSWTATLNFLPSSTVGADEYLLSGLEFSATSNKLVFNRFNACSTCTAPTSITGIWDLTTPSAGTVTYISNNVNLLRGGIELGRDGKLYGASVDGMYEINTSNNALNKVVTLSAGTINLTNDSYMGLNFAIRPLPEQQDGQVLLTDVFHLDDEDLMPTSGDIEFDNTTITTGPLKLRGTVNIKSQISGTSIKFEGINVNPASNAKIVVKPNAIFYLYETNIETMDCHKMWQGIVVEPGSAFETRNNTNPPVEKKICDAIVAVNASGTATGIHIVNYSFYRNGTSIKLTNSCPSRPSQNVFNQTNITDNYFNNKSELKDITKGRIFSVPHSGIVSIEVNQTGSHALPLTISTNIFEGGVNGIRALNSSLILTQNTFKDHLGKSNWPFVNNVNPKYYASAIYSEGANVLSNINDLNINSTNSFINNERHVTAVNGINLNATGPSFTTSKRKAIEWSNNKGCKLIIYGCIFTNCAGNAIRCDFNAYPSENNQSSILIEANTIQNTLYNIASTTNSTFDNYAGNAISLTELAKTSDIGFIKISINQNFIKNLRGGISLLGITGGKNISTQNNPASDPAKYDINENSIILRTSVNALDGDGIQLINSSRLAIFNQKDGGEIKIKNGISNFNTRNAIYLENNVNISVKSNLLNATSGLRGKFSNINSDILCNTFYYCHYGINMSNQFYLRSFYETHGILSGSLAESRTNNYLKNEYSDWHRTHTVLRPYNRWIVRTSESPRETCLNENTGLKCYTFWGANSSLKYGTAPDVCGNLFPTPSNGFSAAVTDSILDPILKWEIDYVNALSTVKQNTTSNFTSKERLILAINNIQLLNYSQAYQLLNFSFNDILDQKTANLLRLLVNLNYPEPRDLTEPEKVDLYSLASLVPSNNGSYVYIARSIIQTMFDDIFGEPDPEYKNIDIQLQNAGCMPDIDNNLINLLDNANNIIDVRIVLDSNLKITIYGEDLVGLDSLGIYKVKVQYMGIDHFVTNVLYNLTANTAYIDMGCASSSGKRAQLDIKGTEQIIINPNPFSSIIDINSTDPAFQNYSVQLFDLSGRLIYFEQYNRAINTLDLSFLTSGAYVIKLTNSNNVYKHFNMIKN